MEKISIQRKAGSGTATIELSGSKSITNRLLIIKHLSASDTTLDHASTSEDSIRLQNYLIQADSCADSRIPMVIDAGNAGTVLRFLTAYLSLREGRWLLTGTDRMLERPVGTLVKSLSQLGAVISYSKRKGYPPLLIQPGHLKGGTIKIDGSTSSQHISSLMLIGPLLAGGLILRPTGEVVSRPYIALTAGIMQQCGVDVQMEESQIIVPESTYQIPSVKVEPDWSSASYWYLVAAIAGKTSIRLPGFRRHSLQGDSHLTEIFSSLGVKTEFTGEGINLSGGFAYEKELNVDMGGHPDLVPAFLTACAAKSIGVTITGIAHLKFKESDRIDSLKKELSKLGAGISYSDGIIRMIPGKVNKQKVLEFNTHGDHRIAMCLAPLAMQFKRVVITDPQVVDKSYPGFWSDLESSGFFVVDKMGNS